jgi:hypothetical protein
VGNSYTQVGAFRSEISAVHAYFNSAAYLRRPLIYDPVSNTTRPSRHPQDTRPGGCKPFVHYFNTTGILQHNDIAPQWHPTDVGHVKVASSLIQYVRLVFGWVLYATGPEVFHETLYWNTEQGY